MRDARLMLLREMADAVSRVVRGTPVERFGEELRMGADGTATKMVDDLAEREILKILERGDAKLDLLSEEAGLVRFGGDALLVADPIDGTTNAARGIPFYCVSLAIGRETLRDVEVGLVLNIPTGDVYEGVRGQGAWMNGRPLRVRPRGKSMVVATGSVSAADMPRRGMARSFGASALEMCLVAQGALDAYYYPKRILRIIDVAASTLIVREAGGIVLGLDGKELELPLSLDPRFGLVAASSAEVAADVGGDAA